MLCLLVDFLDDLLGELQVLSLVISHWDVFRVVKYYVCSHQNGVGEEPHCGAPLLFGLVLNHCVQPTKGDFGGEKPITLGVHGNRALKKEIDLVRIQAAGEQDPDHVERALGNVLSVREIFVVLIVEIAQGMEVSNEDHFVSLVSLGKLETLLDDPQVMPQVEDSGGLDSGDEVDLLEKR